MLFAASGGLQHLGTTDAKELRKQLVKPSRALLETTDGYLAVVNLHQGRNDVQCDISAAPSFNQAYAVRGMYAA